MTTEDPQVMALRTEVVELEHPIAVWQYQSQYCPEVKLEGAEVLLPGSDNRQPSEKRAKDLEVASNFDQQSSFTPPSSSHSSPDSSSSHHPQAKVKIPPKELYQDVKKAPAGPLPLVAQDGGNPHNDSFKAAKLRYQQENLGGQRAIQKTDQDFQSGRQSGKNALIFSPLTSLAS